MRSPHVTATRLLLLVAVTNILLTECRMSGGGSRGGGGGWKSPPSSGSGGRYKPSPPSRPSYPTQSKPSSPGWTITNKPTPTHSAPPKPPSSPNTGHPYGFPTPNKQTPSGTGNTPGHTVPTQQNSPKAPAGWNVQPSSKPVSNPHPAPRPTYGWTSTTHRPNVPQPAPSYGFKNPSAPSAPPKPSVPQTSHPGQSPSYGFKNPSAPSAPPKPSVSQTSHPGQTPSYGIKNPSAPSAPSRKTVPNNAQTPSFNNGKKYEKGYSKGYDTGYKRGLEKGKATVPKAYYPPQSQFGYPGGYTGSHSSYTYGGHSLYGAPHNYGYPVNSAYGCSTYGTGRSGPGFGTGLAAGLVGGYLLNSAIHSSPFSYSSNLGHRYNSPSYSPSNDWGYTGSGYGSDYKYTRVDNSITNNYYFSQPLPAAVNATSPSDTSSETDHWIHCIAFDPMTDTTLTNPNCTCSVSLERDSATNETTAIHTCASAWGTHTERTPVSEVEIFEIEKSTNKTSSPEKLKAKETEERRKEAYTVLETIVNMGCFMC